MTKLAPRVMLLPVAAALLALAGCASEPEPARAGTDTKTAGFTQTVVRCEDSQPTGSKLKTKRCFTAEEIAALEDERRRAGTARTPAPADTMRR
jgi:hypothetical protein